MFNLLEVYCLNLQALNAYYSFNNREGMVPCLALPDINNVSYIKLTVTAGLLRLGNY